MTANKKNSLPKQKIYASDFAKIDAHIIQPEEYEDSPELTEEMIKRGVWMKDGVVISEREGLAGFNRQMRGRPKSPAPKKAIAMRLSQDVLAALKATGKGWQTRIDQILRKELGL